MTDPRIITNKDISDFEIKFSELADYCRANGTIQELLVAMAQRIQIETTCYENRGKLPYDGAVDLIMRAVEHTLRGDPSMNIYVLEKLNCGTKCMNNWMSDEKSSERSA